MEQVDPLIPPGMRPVYTNPLSPTPYPPMPFVDSKVLTRTIEKQPLKTNDLQAAQKRKTPILHQD